MARSTASPSILDHPDLTAMGLLFEANAGIRAAVSPSLEEQHGLAGQRFEVLLRLVRSPSHRLRMTDLAKQTTLTASGLTRVVDRLVDEGLIERTQCSSDRRGYFAELTPAGEARVLAALPDHLAQLREILHAAFSPDEIPVFYALMRRLRDAVHPGATSGS